MSLESLAPDQRAVVQLVLQQERSYDDLAGLLGISTEAVRERARAGLEKVGGSAGDLTDEELGEIADYLLGQQSVSRRGATRSLLSGSADARRWANRVSDALEDVARSPLPGVPAEDEEEGFEADVAAPAVNVPEPTTAPALALPDEDEDEDEPAEEKALVSTPDEAPVRARPRPRPREDAPRPRPGSGGDTAKEARPRASRIGGFLLIAGIAVMLAVAVVFLFRDGDDEEPQTTAENTPTATATAEATPVAGAQIQLAAPDGGDSKGTMTILVTQEQKIQFSIEGTSLPASREGEAYAVWLTGGPKPRRLGFAPPVGNDGKLGVSGPREGAEDAFLRDFGRARKVIISRETSQDAKEPGPVVMEGEIPRDENSG